MRMLANLGRVQKFPAQTIFIHEGDASDGAYVLLSGRVKVFASERNGNEIVLNTCGPGEFIGDLALDGGRRSASVITLEKVVCAVVTQAVLREAIINEPDLALRLINTLIRRFRHATASIKGLALHDVYERVAHLLNGLAQEQGGQWQVSERLSQQEIAHRVGASRDMVSRVLKEMASMGAIKIERKVITLAHRPRA